MYQSLHKNIWHTIIHRCHPLSYNVLRFLSKYRNRKQYKEMNIKKRTKKVQGKQKETHEEKPPAADPLQTAAFSVLFRWGNGYRYVITCLQQTLC